MMKELKNAARRISSLSIHGELRTFASTYDLAVAANSSMDDNRNTRRSEAIVWSPHS